MNKTLTSWVTTVTLCRSICSLRQWRCYGCQDRCGGPFFRADQAGRFLGGLLVLGEARLHKLRGACGTDRHHAQGAGGEETLGLREPVFEDAQLLHVATRSRGAAGGDLHRVETARDGGWGRGRLLLRRTLHLRVVAALVPGRGPLGRAGDHGSSLWHTACGDSHSRRGRPEDFQACPQPLPARSLLGRSIRRPVLLLRSLPARGACRRPRRTPPEPRGTRSLRKRRAWFFRGGRVGCGQGRIPGPAFGAA